MKGQRTWVVYEMPLVKSSEFEGDPERYRTFGAILATCTSQEAARAACFLLLSGKRGFRNPVQIMNEPTEAVFS